MAQASSSAQREPSMEEILASIRRIIEDSDAGDGESNTEAPQEAADDTGVDKAAEAVTEPEAVPTEEYVEPADTVVETNETDFESITSADIDAVTADEITNEDEMDDEVRSFRDELNAVDEPEEETQAADNSMNALSMADIQAEVAMQASPEVPELVEAEFVEPESVEPELVESEEQEAEPHLTEHIDSGTGDESLPDDDSLEELTGIMQVPNVEAEPAADVEQIEESSLAALAETIMAEDMDAMREGLSGSPIDVSPTAKSGEDVTTTAPVAAHAPIISEQAGRQVAAAFDELSDAFSQTRQKSFDEMAEDMMRPMLQDWLDNNLPVLVERLVREEIDRVARGNSRS